MNRLTSVLAVLCVVLLPLVGSAGDAAKASVTLESGKDQHRFGAVLAFYEDGFVHLVLTRAPDAERVKALGKDGNGFVKIDARARKGMDLFKGAMGFKKGESGALVTLGPVAALKDGAVLKFQKIDGPPNKSMTRMKELAAKGGWCFGAALRKTDAEAPAGKAYKSGAPWQHCKSGKVTVKVRSIEGHKILNAGLDFVFKDGTTLKGSAPIRLKAYDDGGLEGISLFPFGK